MCLGSPPPDASQRPQIEAAAADGKNGPVAQMMAKNNLALLDKADAAASVAPKIPLLPSPAPQPSASYLGRAIQPLPDPSATTRANNPYLIPLIK